MWLQCFALAHHNLTNPPALEYQFMPPPVDGQMNNNDNIDKTILLCSLEEDIPAQHPLQSPVMGFQVQHLVHLLGQPTQDLNCSQLSQMSQNSTGMISPLLNSSQQPANEGRAQNSACRVSNGTKTSTNVPSVPANRNTNQRGRRGGNCTNEEKKALFDILEQHLPVGNAMWDVVFQEFD